MAVEERARQDLFDRLEQVLGTPHALTLMAYLPQVEGPDVATSGDVAQVRSDLTDLDLNLGQRFEAIDQRFEAMDQRFEAIDRRFDAVDHRFELVDQRFAALERHIDTRLEAVEHRIVGTIRGEMATLVTTQTRVIVLGLVGALTANTGLVLAAPRLG
ncbi:MAG: hypothetical protein M3493_10315 [Actinomycetota bacterium]|jgi:hypothetical protein|nr:hypothetical protein [Actinomycetota bacterium]